MSDTESSQRIVRSQCPYCGVGCGVEMHVSAGKIVKITGDKQHPANFGKLCTKGLTSHQPVTADTRLNRFLKRVEGAADFRSMSPDSAIDEVSANLQTIIAEHGPNSVGFYLSGQLSTEAQYVANKLAKGFWRTNNVESNSRLCMASASCGYKASLGADAPPGSYADIEEADAFFITGANMADCHPILFQRLLQRRRLHGAKIIVVDPRRTATAAKADIHLTVNPGTDLWLLNGLAHLLREANAFDFAFMARHVDGWREYVSSLDAHTLETTAAKCGVEANDLRRTAQILSEASRWMSFWTMGLNQSARGTDNTSAVCNLHLATGQIGKTGAGPFSLTGQPNAMGGREVGYLAAGLPGQRKVTDPADRTFTEKVWGLPENTIQAEPGRHAKALFQALANGEMKALWIIGSNPIATMANRNVVTKALERADLVIVQDAFFPNETTAYADYVFPAALSMEALGTMTNSERRITLLEPAVAPPGDAAPDWQIISHVARKMGFEDAFAYQDAEAIFDELKRFHNPESGWDIRGITYEKLRRQPMQWPCAEGQEEGQHLRDGRVENGSLRFPTANGRARLRLVEPSDAIEKPNGDFPFVLNTGRLPHHWHTLTKTGTVSALTRLHKGPFAEVNSGDAERLGIVADGKVSIESRRGKLVLPVLLSNDIRSGHIFVPMHWSDRFGAELSVNEATSDALDPVSFQPELKAAAVRLTAVATEAPDDTRSLEEIFAEGMAAVPATFAPSQKAALARAFTSAHRPNLQRKVS